MAIEVRLFGNLREKGTNQNYEVGAPSVQHIDNSNLERIEDVLKRFSINEDEVCHIFVNGTYSGLRKKVSDGDRIGIFPRNMAVLYKWYFKREEDE
jgi:molybdopterin converting factor small subunit